MFCIKPLISGLLFVFKFLLCNKLENVSKLDYSEVRLIIIIINIIIIIINTITIIR